MSGDREQIRALIERAVEARENAYAPYSGFKVGAALLTGSGKVYTGCNVESVSYTPTTCAERVAVLKAVSEGERSFQMIAVYGAPAEGPSKTDGYTAPCGVCRQLLYEFGRDIAVVIAKSVDEYRVYSISELMPHGFGPDNLL